MFNTFDSVDHAMMDIDAFINWLIDNDIIDDGIFYEYAQKAVEEGYIIQVGEDDFRSATTLEINEQ